jgi:hypothetical protein
MRSAILWCVIPMLGRFVAVTCTDMGTPLVLISAAPRYSVAEAEADGRESGLTRFTLF